MIDGGRRNEKGAPLGAPSDNSERGGANRRLAHQCTTGDRVETTLVFALVA